jgi:hypothetical protein
VANNLGRRLFFLTKINSMNKEQLVADINIVLESYVEHYPGEVSRLIPKSSIPDLMQDIKDVINKAIQQPEGGREVYEIVEIKSEKDLPEESGKYHVENKTTGNKATAFFKNGAFWHHSLDKVTHWLKRTTIQQVQGFSEQEVVEVLSMVIHADVVNKQMNHSIFTQEQQDRIFELIDKYETHATD